MSANPCIFKNECRTCTRVYLTNRPKGCNAIECKDYVPCIKCSLNKYVDEEGVCKSCREKIEKPDAEERTIADLVNEANEKISLGNSTEEDSMTSLPGIPHSRYSPEESDYYLRQWDEYKTYYRDPSAFPIIHNLIVMEIELLNLSSLMIRLRKSPSASDSLKDIEKRHQSLVQSMKVLRDQLPRKEAEELSDDEKSICMIFEKYNAELRRRRKFGVKRVFSTEAIALAPKLHFPVNLNLILKKLGYAEAEIEDVLSMTYSPEEIPTNSIEVVEFLGMPIREELAPEEKEDQLKSGDIVTMLPEEFEEEAE